MLQKNKKLYAAIFFVFLSTASAAYELEYELRAGVGHTDNIARTEIDGIDETVGVAGVELDYEYLSRGFELNVLADIEFRHYVDSSFDDDTFGSINADLVLNLSDDVLTWGVEHRLGHVIADPFAAENPRTRERINTLATGPNVRIPLGAATSLGIIGRIGTDNFSETDSDNDNLGGNIILTRALSRNRSLSLNLTANRIEYDNTVLNSSFDRQAAFVAFVSENSRGSLNISVGHNELHDRGIVEDGSFFDVEWSRQLTAGVDFNLAISNQLTFATELFGDFQTQGLTFGDTRDIVGIADPLEATIARASVGYERGANNLFVSFSTQEEDFIVDNGLDRTNDEFRAGVGRRIGSAWQIDVAATFRNSDFDQDPREDDDLIVTLGLQRQITNSLSLSLDLAHSDRDSNVADSSYTENSGFLTVRYSR